MELVFALITYLGAQKLDTSYFRNIDDCMYFAVRINKNVGVPNMVDDGGTTPDESFIKQFANLVKLILKRVKVY